MEKAKTSIIKLLKEYRTSHLVIAFLLFWSPVIVFLKIAGEILERQPIGIDTQILTWIHNGATPALDALFFFITSLGNIESILPVTILIILIFLYKNQRRNALLVTFGVGGAAAANVILKMLFQRDRPAFWQTLITETGYSFPSGHAMVSSALVLCLIVILWRTKWRYMSLILGASVVLLIGYSRLYLGVHYPTDIVAGWSISAAWVATTLAVLHVTYKSGSKIKVTTPNSRSSSAE